MASFMPTDPKQKKAAGIGFGAIVLFALFWMYLYTPEKDALTEMQARLETLEQGNRRAQITAARGAGEIEERLAAYERHVMVLEELIPASDEVPALLRQITSEARRIIGQDPSTFRPEPDEPGEFYTKKAYQMQAIGEFHDVARFLAAIASLPRIITPLDVSLAPYDNSTALQELESPVVAEFRIETFVLPQPGETAAPPPAQVGG